MARKVRKARKKTYGGLSPRHVSLIRAYLRKERSTPPGQPVSVHSQAYAAHMLWAHRLLDDETGADDAAGARHLAKKAGLRSGTIAALKAGIAVMRRRGVGAFARGVSDVWPRVASKWPQGKSVSIKCCVVPRLKRSRIRWLLRRVAPPVAAKSKQLSWL
jgi:hypothetical protein